MAPESGLITVFVRCFGMSLHIHKNGGHWWPLNIVFLLGDNDLDFYPAVTGGWYILPIWILTKTSYSQTQLDNVTSLSIPAEKS